MGLAIDREEFTEQDYRRFCVRLRESLKALRELLERPGFGEGPITLGAELELSIVDASGRALPLNRTLLSKSHDPRLQLELDRFNIEYNLTPLPTCGEPFSALELEMEEAIADLGAIAQEHGGRVVPIGILPTLQEHDLQAHAMTDTPRFRALSAALRNMRNGPFQLRIDGEESLTLDCDDVTFEGAATSMQVHLHVSPNEFAATHNAVQLATPFALAIAANSPFFLGRSLWDETRVVLFKQAVDGRGPPTGEWRRPARVSFGTGWLRHGAYELFAEGVELFPPLLPITSDENLLECVRAGGIPQLHELRLHQGTIWRWNRPIYDPSGHLRIELRALPAGPSPRDMVTNAAFLVGLAMGLRREVEDLITALPFEYAHRNFYRAAKHGLDAGLIWPTPHAPSPQERPARELLLELLPKAEEGLALLGVSAGEIRLLLSGVRARIESDTTPARWQRRILTQLDARMPRQEALAGLLEAYIRELGTGRPIYEWSLQI